MTTGFPKSIFEYPDSVVAKAPMPAYKRKDAHTFDGVSFDHEKPWFVRLWGVVKPGGGANEIEMNATMMGEEFVELFAFVGVTMEGFRMLMRKEDFDRDYKLD